MAQQVDSNQIKVMGHVYVIAAARFITIHKSKTKCFSNSLVFQPRQIRKKQELFTKDSLRRQPFCVRIQNNLGSTDTPTITIFALASRRQPGTHRQSQSVRVVGGGGAGHKERTRQGFPLFVFCNTLSKPSPISECFLFTARLCLHGSGMQKDLTPV